jgi:putative DNA primase/helicase
MVAAVRNAAGDIVAIHRTYLTIDGNGKAPVNPQKMTLGPIGGGAVRLATAGPALLVGEGIESTLAAMMLSGLPGWAALSAGGIKALILPPLPIAAKVTIAADNDPVGLEAAYAAADRWAGEGRTVRIAKPPAGQDFNDLIEQEGCAHAA